MNVCEIPLETNSFCDGAFVDARAAKAVAASNLDSKSSGLDAFDFRGPGGETDTTIAEHCSSTPRTMMPLRSTSSYCKKNDDDFGRHGRLGEWRSRSFALKYARLVC